LFFSFAPAAPALARRRGAGSFKLGFITFFINCELSHLNIHKIFLFFCFLNIKMIVIGSGSRKKLGEIWENPLLPNEVVDKINFYNLKWWEILKLLAEGTHIDENQVLHLSPTFQLLIPGMERFSIPLHEFMYPNSNLAEKQVIFDHTKQVKLGVFNGSSSFRDVLNQRFPKERELGEQDMYNNPIIDAVVAVPYMDPFISGITIIFLLQKIGRGIKYLPTKLRITVNNQSGEIFAYMAEPTNFYGRSG
jgi:hypothetical protein